MEANRFTLKNEFWRKFSAAKGFVAGWNYQVSSFIGLQQDKGILGAYWTAHKQVARLTFQTADQIKWVEYLRAEWNSLILWLKSMPRNHQGEILEDIFEPSISSLYPGGLCIFQQDSAPVTTRKRRKPGWLPMRRIHQVGYWMASWWPPSSPDLNPLDFCVRGMLETVVNAKPHHSAKALQWKLKENGRDYWEIQCVPL